ncbi:MAG: peptide chain release factor N(5)-glutamine methyltransferase [Thermoanaerobaculum sp.]
MTIAELLAEARQALVPREGMLFPQREARSFLAALLGVEEAFVLAHPEHPVEDAAARRFREFVTRRAKGEPFHAILGACPFFGRSFLVAPGVLVPRPETELLMERVLKLPLPPSPRVLDVGTGSGVLAVTLACEIPGARVFAGDLSLAAAILARRNAAHFGVRVEVTVANLAAPLRGPFHLVVANLPYLPESFRTRTPPELHYEDATALFAGPDGLALLRPLVADLPRLLAPRCFAALELGEGQAAALVSDLPQALEPHDVVYDLRGVERVLLLRRR